MLLGKYWKTVLKSWVIGSFMTWYQIAKMATINLSPMWTWTWTQWKYDWQFNTLMPFTCRLPNTHGDSTFHVCSIAGYSEGGAMNGEVPSVPITTLAGLASLTHCKYSIFFPSKTTKSLFIFVLAGLVFSFSIILSKTTNSLQSAISAQTMD